MCSVGIALAVAGGVASFAGQIQQARAAQQAANFQAAVANNNAIIAQRMAANARAQGEADAEEIQLEGQDAIRKRAEATLQLIGRQRVAQAGLGQTTDVGSALDLNVDAAATGKLDELQIARNVEFQRKQIRRNAELEAIGFISQGLNFQAESVFQKSQAQAARRAGVIGGLGTLITTAGTVHSRWRNRVPTLQPSVSTGVSGFGSFGFGG